MKKKFLSLFFTVLVLISTLSALTYAHLEGEAIKTKSYRFEFTFINTPNIDSDNAIVVKIENSEGLPLSNKSVWMRISKNNNVLFSSNNFITDDSGSVIISYKFTDYGKYNIDASVVSNEVAHYDFEITQEKTTVLEYLLLALIFVLVFMITKSVMLKHLRKNSDNSKRKS